MGYSPWGHKELDTTEQLSMHVTGSASTLHSANLGLRGKGRRDLRGCGPEPCGWETLGRMARETWTWEFRPKKQIGKRKSSQSYNSLIHPSTTQPSIHRSKSPSIYPPKPLSIQSTVHLSNQSFTHLHIHPCTPSSWPSTNPVHQPFTVWTDVQVILQTGKSRLAAHDGATGPSHPLAKTVS